MEWTEKLIEEEIKKHMLDKKINRMPISQELRDNKQSGLSSAISKTGGFSKWAKKLNLERKEKETTWSDERIKEEILRCISSLGINRMPTTGEIQGLGRNDLHCAIGRTKRYNGWAEELELSMTDCNTRVGESYEQIVKLMLESKGYNVEKMSTKFPYDLLVNGRVKIDVKCGHMHNHFKSSFGITFGINKPKQTSDIYILVSLDKNNEIGNFYVIPSHLIKMKTLNMGLRSKYNEYIDCWNYIEKTDKFYESIKS